MSKPIAHLLDAALTLAFLLALVAGIDLRLVFGVWLAVAVIEHIAKAFVAILNPIVDAMRRARADC